MIIELEAPLTRRKTTVLWRALALGLPAFTALGGAAIGAYGNLVVAKTQLAPMTVTQVDTIARDASALLRTALTSGRPYAIAGISSWIRLDPVRLDSTSELTAEQHITYVLQATRDISVDSGDFQEWYHGSSPLDYLPGPDPEDISDYGDHEKRWSVGFDLPRNQYRTVVTGVLRHYAQNSGGVRYDHMGRPLAPAEQEFCYPNDGDVIGEELIVVESSALRFVAGDKKTRAYRVNPGQKPRQLTPVIYGPQRDSPQRSVATVRASRIGAKENVCLIAAWESTGPQL
jgi:hypothetical protein